MIAAPPNQRTSHGSAARSHPKNRMAVLRVELYIAGVAYYDLLHCIARYHNYARSTFLHQKALTFRNTFVRGSRLDAESDGHPLLSISSTILNFFLKKKQE